MTTAALVAGNTGDREAGRADPRHRRAAMVRLLEAAGAARRRAQLPARPGRRGRRLPGPPSRRRPHRLHRLEGGRPAHHQPGRAAHPRTDARQEGHRRDGRQERDHRRRRRRPRRGRARGRASPPSATPARSARPARGSSCSRRPTTSSSRRLVEATRSLVVGPPEDPATRVGPVIDRRRPRQDRGLHRAGQAGGDARRRRAGRPRAAGPATASTSPRTIFADVRPDAVIAQEEIFGPVLAVMQAADLDEALAIANGAATRSPAACISRSPAAHRAGPAASSASATCTSTAASPGPWSSASRSAASR